MKPTSTKALLLALLLVLGMFVSPVSAGYDIVTVSEIVHAGGTSNVVEQTSDLTVDLLSEGKAIQQLEVDLGSGTTVNFTLWYGNGETVSGWMVYRNSIDCWGWFPGDFCQYSGVSIGTDSEGSSTRGFQEVGKIDIVAYARNWTSDKEYTQGFLIFDTVAGLPEGHSAYYQVANATNSIVYKFHVAATSPVKVTYLYNTRAKIVAGTGSGNPLNIISEWIELASKFAKSAIDFIWGVFWIIKFFFIDNLLLIIVLWISVSMAYAAISSANIFIFYKKFFGLQRALVDFIISLWRILWEIVNYGVQIFVKWL